MFVERMGKTVLLAFLLVVTHDWFAVGKDLQNTGPAVFVDESPNNSSRPTDHKGVFTPPHDETDNQPASASVKPPAAFGNASHKAKSRSQRETVAETTEVQDQIVGPTGARIPVASSINTHSLPTAPRRNVIESTETQDTVVGANGQAVPVAASSDLHRVARQISGPLQQPRVSDTGETQDSVVLPNGAEVLVARSAQTAASPLTVPIVQPVPHLSDTVEVQDSVVHPNGAEVPVARSVQTAAAPLTSPINRSAPHTSDTVEVQDSVVLPSGAEVPVARSTQSAALPLGMAPLGIQAAPLVTETEDTEDSVVLPNGAEVPVASSTKTAAAPVAVPGVRPIPHVSDTVEVQDSVVSPLGVEVPVARSSQVAAQPLGWSSAYINPFYNAHLYPSYGLSFFRRDFPDTLSRGVSSNDTTALSDILATEARPVAFAPPSAHTNPDISRPTISGQDIGLQPAKKLLTPKRRTTRRRSTPTAQSTTSTPFFTTPQESRTTDQNSPSHLHDRDVSNSSAIHVTSSTVRFKTNVSETILPSVVRFSQNATADSEAPVSRELHEIYQIAERAEKTANESNATTITQEIHEIHEISEGVRKNNDSFHVENKTSTIAFSERNSSAGALSGTKLPNRMIHRDVASFRPSRFTRDNRTAEQEFQDELPLATADDLSLAAVADRSFLSAKSADLPRNSTLNNFKGQVFD